MQYKERKVSVIIPAYNAESSLEACINSALEQTLVPFEIFVINDGSTDNTAEIAKNYGNRIIYCEQENQGQGAARNTGLQRAKGDYIAFLDADDYWLDRFLETCVAYLEENKDTIAVSTGIIVKLVNNEEYILPKALHGKDSIRNPVILDNFFTFWAEQDHVRTGSNVIRKSTVDEAGPQRADLRISQDLEYWGYIATFGKWGFIPEPLWVGNSRAAAAPGLTKKYRHRRSLCPSVESWEQRIVPRLRDDEKWGFQMVRGRVAAAYAHSKILGGDATSAYHIIKKYQSSMPRNKVTSLMRMGAFLGKFGWLIVCYIIRLKELAKAWRLRIRTGMIYE